MALIAAIGVLVRGRQHGKGANGYEKQSNTFASRSVRSLRVSSAVNHAFLDTPEQPIVPARKFRTESGGSPLLNQVPGADHSGLKFLMQLTYRWTGASACRSRQALLVAASGLSQ
jgi:hypothetical protein